MISRAPIGETNSGLGDMETGCVTLRRINKGYRLEPTAAAETGVTRCIVNATGADLAPEKRSFVRQGPNPYELDWMLTSTVGIV